MDWTLPVNLSTQGGGIDTLYYVILALTGVAFVLVEAGILWFLWRYRGGRGEGALYHHGSDRLEILWTTVPAVVFVVLAFYSGRIWNDLKGTGGVPDDAMELSISAKQFEWNITYPGLDAEMGTADDFTVRNHLHVPARRPVLARLRSEDVIHSFFIPALRVKQDVVPGMETSVWFEARKPTSLELACAELCGLGHYRMRAQVTVHEPSEYRAWSEEQSRQARAATGSASGEAAPAGAAPQDRSTTDGS